MASRLEVLARHLTLAEQPGGLAAVCPKKLGAYIAHDNMELRAAIFEFLKVWFTAAKVAWPHGKGWRRAKSAAALC